MQTATHLHERRQANPSASSPPGVGQAVLGLDFHFLAGTERNSMASTFRYVGIENEIHIDLRQTSGHGRDAAQVEFGQLCGSPSPHPARLVDRNFRFTCPSTLVVYWRPALSRDFGLRGMMGP
jgi:hypothetical protein